MPVDIRGQQIGQLRIVEQLGEGGMGAVFLAEHTYIVGVRRAVKVLHHEFTQRDDVVQRFFNEARASGKLAHRNIVGVHDLGQLPDGTYFIIFDYVPGQTLARCIETSPPLPPREIVRYVSQIANALGRAHALGIVHRDLKPENVMLTAREGDELHVVVLDWGIASLSGDLQTGPRTKTGMLIGTVAYMSPEQILGKRIDPATDVFALGIIAYRMATGGWFPYQVESTPAGKPDYEAYYGLTPTQLYERQRLSPPMHPQVRGALLRDEFVRALLAPLNLHPAQRPSPQEYALMLADEAPPEGRGVVFVYARELLGASATDVSLTTQLGGHALLVGAPAASSGQEKPRYALRERIGVGGMAEVFLASMTSKQGITRTVAVKRVLPAYSKDKQFVKMFLDEAHLAAQLQHKNIVNVEDCDCDAEGQLFIAMEYIDGRDLDALASTGLLPISVTIFIITEILYALRYAHSLPRGRTIPGVVHRDISPSNVLLSWDGAVMLSDFGLAKALTGAVAGPSLFLKGKPRYMSPEQVQNHDLDGRSDLFAVGVVLWELLAGPDQHLFDASSRDEVLHQVKHGEIRPPSRHNANVKSDLDRVTLTLLERDVGKRYANANAAIEALLRCADADPHGRHELVRLMGVRFPAEAEARAARPLSRSEPTLAPTQPALPAGAPRVSQPPTTHGTASGHAVASAPSARWRWLAVGLVGAVAVVVAVIAAQTGDSELAAVTTGSSAEPATTAGSAVPGTAATLKIETDPPHAVVRIDGAPRGKAPITVAVVPGRRIEIDAAREGFASTTKTVTVGPGNQTVVVQLGALPSDLPSAVVPRPDAATIVPDAPPARPARPKPRPSRQGSGSGSSFDSNGVSTNTDW